MKIIFCSHCNASNPVPIHYIGRKVKCGSCGSQFQAYDEDASVVESSQELERSKKKSGCFGCSLFLGIPIGLFGLVGLLSSITGYETESTRTRNQLKINSDFEMKSEGRPRAEFERVSTNVTKEADSEQRLYAGVISVILIGTSIGLVFVARTNSRGQVNFR